MATQDLTSFPLSTLFCFFYVPSSFLLMTFGKDMKRDVLSFYLFFFFSSILETRKKLIRIDKGLVYRRLAEVSHHHHRVAVAPYLDEKERKNVLPSLFFFFCIMFLPSIHGPKGNIISFNLLLYSFTSATFGIKQMRCFQPLRGFSLSFRI